MGKKICMFAANYLPHIGGIENYTYHLSKELVSMGNIVTVVTSNQNHDLPYEHSEGIEIYRMPCYSLIGDRYPVCKVNKEFREIDKELERHNFDLIIIHARFYFHSVYAAKFAHKHKIKCFTIEHGTSHLSVNNRLLDYFGGIWEHGITAILKRYCHHYYGVSRLACEWSGHFGIKSEGVVYNAVDIDDINKRLSHPVCQYRRKYGIPPDSLVITFIGRLIPEKGIVQLVEALHEMDLENTYLFVAGDGILFDELQQKKYANTFILGAIDFSNVIALLSESDIYCLPSVSEGLPTSILEAIAAKTFVITNKRSGATEIVTDQNFGIVMESNTVKDIKKAIQDSLNKEYRKACVDRCYSTVIERFTWKQTAEQVLKIYNEMGAGT